jgi:hypothetical protein
VLTQGPGRPAAVGGTLVALATVVVGVVLGLVAFIAAALLLVGHRDLA